MRGDTIVFMLIDGQVGSLLMKFKPPFMCVCACVCNSDSVRWRPVNCLIDLSTLHKGRLLCPPPSGCYSLPSPLSSILIFLSPLMLPLPLSFSFFLLIFAHLYHSSLLSLHPACLASLIWWEIDRNILWMYLWFHVNTILQGHVFSGVSKATMCRK